MTRPNSVATNYAYDNLSRLISALHQLSGSTIDGATYTVDNAGNRTAKTDNRTSVASSYGYDTIYELTGVTQGTTTTESYTYDAVGNRLSSLGVSPYSVNVSNELTATPNTTYTYDNNGNTLTSVTGSNTTTYAWDFEDRLSSVTLPGTGGTVSFAYDPFGRRIKKVSSAGTSIYAYHDDGNLIEETNAAGTVVARYSQGLGVDEPLAMLRSSATSYYHADGLGSVTSLSNATGALAQTYTLDSFGNQTASSGSLTNPFRYTGREFDPETSLYFYRARYYDPKPGRFITEDPTDFAGGVNFYQYAMNQPIDNSDPFGLKCITKIMLVTAYCDKKKRTASGSRPGPGTVATADTNAPSRGPNRKPIPYPFGCSVTVDNAAGGDPWPTEYEGTILDKGAGWDSWWKDSKHHHHDVLPDAWIDIWMASCKKARQYGDKYRTVTICCKDKCD